ncbi:MAG: U32 family peptidase [Collinsella sp.]|nr:U32 family peptidase [Collinsella sp.]
MSRVPELLAPAGTYEALLAAVAAGADAVYTGAGAFNARAAARDLDGSELRRGAALAHAHGARLYVTMNSLLRDDEFPGAVALAQDVLDVGADALIVADLGLARALSRAIPGVEIHLSTQAGVHAPDGARLAVSELGASRVTCGRELSLPEIADLVATGVEIEAFCHGAICICYAGACSFSALRAARSANRGDCTQPCRMHHALEDGARTRLDAREGDLLLCPRDHLSIRHLPELVRMGVGALKIEGRMKNPDYVHNVVSCYREALDAIAAGRPFDPSAIEERLARSFNRGFTVEYLEGRSGAEMMSWERSCHQGLAVGRVVERRRDEVVVAFERAVEEGDVLEIRFIPGESAPADVPKRWPMVPCPVSVGAGERACVHCKRKVDVGSVVHVVRSARLVDGAARSIAALDPTVADPARSRPTRRDAPPAPAFDPVCSPSGCEPSRISIVEDPVVAERLLGDGGTEVAVVAERLLEDDADRWDGLLGEITVILDEVARIGDEGRHRELMRRARTVVCRNLTQVAQAREEGVRFEVAAPVNVTNALAARTLADLGARRIWLPEELDLEATVGLARSIDCDIALAAWGFGRPRLMVTEHCVLTAEGPCPGRCASCSRRLAQRFLVEPDGARLPVRVDPLGRSRIFDAEPIDRLGESGLLAGAGIGGLVVDLRPLSRPDGG